MGLTTNIPPHYRDLNKIQQYFSAEKCPVLWRAFPAIEELQTSWEAKCDNIRFRKYRDAIKDGLAKLAKYYSRFDEKPAYILTLGMLLKSVTTPLLKSVV